MLICHSFKRKNKNFTVFNYVWFKYITFCYFFVEQRKNWYLLSNWIQWCNWCWIKLLLVYCICVMSCRLLCTDTEYFVSSASVSWIAYYSALATPNLCWSIFWGMTSLLIKTPPLALWRASLSQVCLETTYYLYLQKQVKDLEILRTTTLFLKLIINVVLGPRNNF